MNNKDAMVSIGDEEAGNLTEKEKIEVWRTLDYASHPHSHPTNPYTLTHTHACERITAFTLTLIHAGKHTHKLNKHTHTKPDSTISSFQAGQIPSLSSLSTHSNIFTNNVQFGGGRGFNRGTFHRSGVFFVSSVGSWVSVGNDTFCSASPPPSGRSIWSSPSASDRKGSESGSYS